MGSRLRHHQRSALNPSVTTGAVADPGTCMDYAERITNTDIVTENPINESALPARLLSRGYQVLPVAGKYLSWFDHPEPLTTWRDDSTPGYQCAEIAGSVSGRSCCSRSSLSKRSGGGESSACPMQPSHFWNATQARSEQRRVAFRNQPSRVPKPLRSRSGIKKAAISRQETPDEGNALTCGNDSNLQFHARPPPTPREIYICHWGTP